MGSVARQRVYGVVFFLAALGMVVGTVMAYNKTWERTVTVEYRTDDVGFALVPNADVKVNGVMAGRVNSALPDGTQVVVELKLNPDVASQLPGNVTARLLPKTLFGERYVDLTLPAERQGALENGAVIQQDKNGNSVEVAQLLDSLLPVLEAIPPQNLSRTLGALSTALQGKGEVLGRSIDNLDTLITGINETEPELTSLIQDFGVAARAYETALPDLVSALNNFRTTTGTIGELQAPLNQAMTSFGDGTLATAGLLENNKQQLVNFSVGLRDTFGYLARASPTFGCTFNLLAEVVTRSEKIAGFGDINPGVRSTIKIVNPKGRYLPNQDEPRFFDDRGPQCYDTLVDPDNFFPMAPGGATADGAYSVPSRNPGPPQLAALPFPQFGLGADQEGSSITVNALQREAYRELVAVGMGAETEQVASWTTLLAAPVLSNAEVSLG